LLLRVLAQVEAVFLLVVEVYLIQEVPEEEVSLHHQEHLEVEVVLLHLVEVVVLLLLVVVVLLLQVVVFLVAVVWLLVEVDQVVAVNWLLAEVEVL